MRRRRRRIVVRGLVRLRERVREQVSRGLDPAALLELRREVEGMVGGLEQLCRDAGVTPARLPAPTRNAYRYLKALAFDRLPAGDRALARSVRMRGVVEAYDLAIERLSVAEPDFAAARAGIAGSLAQVREVCRRCGIVPSDLPARSAAAHEALAALAVPGAAEELAATRLRAERLAVSLLSSRRRALGRLRLRLKRTSSLWRMRETGGAVDLVLSDAFAAAPDEVLEAVLRWSLAPGGGSGRGIAERWLEARAAPPPALPGSAAALGLHHDLDRLFDEVNREHFGGAVERPRLAWSAGPTYHRFGYYTYAQDRVVLSSSLDRPEVPGFVVAFVLYHELLHKTLGRHGDGQRRRAHTSAFRARERLFPRHEDASAFLDGLARRGRR